MPPTRPSLARLAVQQPRSHSRARRSISRGGPSLGAGPLNSCRASSTCAYGERPAKRWTCFLPTQPDAPVLVFIHGGYWRALDKSRLLVRRAVVRCAGAMVVVPNYALCPAVSDRADRAADDAGAGLDLAPRRAVRRRPAAHRVAGPLRRRPSGGDAAELPLEGGGRRPARAAGRAARCRSPACIDLEPLRHAPFLQADLHLTPAVGEAPEPGVFPRPSGTLYATVGRDESDEFLRQNQLIREVGRRQRCRCARRWPAATTSTVLHGLVDPAGRLHELALRLLGLR